MPSFGPVKRRELVLPNPHRRDISSELLARILRQAGVSREDWEKLT